MANNYIVYAYKYIKIKIDSRIFYHSIQKPMINTIEKVLRVIPFICYSESLREIVIGENKFVPPQDSSVFYKNTIFITPYFMTTDSPLVVLQRILVHELGHAFIEGWKENIKYSRPLKDEYQSFFNKVLELVPELKEFLPKRNFELPMRLHIEDFIRKFGDNEIKIRLFPYVRSPYAVVSLEEFIAYNFEEFFLGDAEKVKQVAPSIYFTLKRIMNK